MNNYTTMWSSATPGFIIFLIDQSASMQEEFTADKNKAEFTASVINETINDLILQCSSGNMVKDRLFVSLIGYGGKGGTSVDDIRSGYISSFAESPLRFEAVKKNIPDGDGGFIEIEEEVPIFIEPTCPENGLTPMAEAFEFAKQLVTAWIEKKPKNPAPVIINISDGFPFTGKDDDDEDIRNTTNKAYEIMSMHMDDGNPLVFNIHLGIGKECRFEESSLELPDENAKFLFSISSKVPRAYKEVGRRYDFDIRPNSRGFISNASADSFIKFISFGSSSK
ncbi:hypothetical protein [Capnocytophaga cynodegmi]|uniref:hypothetical protein n=1 Tax=Capnocytophaga cynodegmi TaxID=28189 RepID=UPI003859895B